MQDFEKEKGKQKMVAVGAKQNNNKGQDKKMKRDLYQWMPDGSSRFEIFDRNLCNCGLTAG